MVQTAICIFQVQTADLAYFVAEESIAAQGIWDCLLGDCPSVRFSAILRGEKILTCGDRKIDVQEFHYVPKVT
jgi:hypothetical protein